MPKRSPDRRTQEERSARTRTKILDATIDCLVELGYAATSTPEVCRRADMSRGALLHHFPTKAELVIHAVVHLASLRGQEISSGKTHDATTKDPLGPIFDLLWEAFSDRLFHAALELWVAARCDTELMRALVPVERAMGQGITRLWSSEELDTSLSPVQRARVDDLVTLTLHMLRGMALQRILKHDDASRSRLFEVWKDIARREFDALREQNRIS